jgi:cytochrome P450 family 110
LPPGPRMLAAHQLYAWLRDPHALLDRCAHELGVTFTLDLSILSRATVVVTDPEHVREVFVAPRDVLAAGEANAVFEPFVGPGSLFLLDAAAHARHRRLLAAAFRPERMRAYFGEIVDSVDRAASAWTRATPFRFYDVARAITLEVLVRAVFGARGAEALAAFGPRAREMVDICAKPHLLLAPARVDLGAWSPWGRVLRSMRELDARIREHVAAMRREPDAPGRDVLSMLAFARDESGTRLTDAELRDELVTLLVAGNETTASGLAWTLDEMLNAPAELDKVRVELRAVLDGNDLRPEHVPELVRLDACVREALRLHPPITNAIRVVKKPFRLGRWELCPGTEVAPCMHLTHRRADLYPDPLVYRPDRFVGRTIDPYAYFPFGGGSRRCMGMSLARYEITVALARLLSRCELRLSSTERPRARRRALLMVPSTGVPVIAERLRERE